MSDDLRNLLSFTAIVCLCAWFVYLNHKKFGWAGVAVRVAVFISGIFIGFTIECHQMPWSALRHVLPVFHDDATETHLGLFCFAWTYFLAADRPMRWLMWPIVKWAVYSSAVLVFVGMYGGLKGWF